MSSKPRVGGSNPSGRAILIQRIDGFSTPSQVFSSGRPFGELNRLDLQIDRNGCNLTLPGIQEPNAGSFCQYSPSAIYGDASMGRSISRLLVAALILAVSSNAFASSKPLSQKKEICDAKMAAKHVTKANWQAEHAKCWSDPDGYQ